MKLYVSGPMRGYPKFNFPTFDLAEQILKLDNHEVFNPAAHDRELYPDIESWAGFESGDPAQCPAFNLPASLAWDFKAIAECDGIVLLGGWEKSSGARAERFVAEVTGKKVFFFSARAEGRGAILLQDLDTRMEYPAIKETV